MKNKKVVFIDFLDVIKIPSKAEKPTNAADFQLDCDFIKALKQASNIVRVNLLGSTNGMGIGNEDQKKMLSVISYGISLYADKTVLSYCEPGKLHKAFGRAAKDASNIEFFNDKKFWLMIGDKESIGTFDIDTLSVEDFCNGEIEKDTK